MTIKYHVISNQRHLWVLQFRLNAINIPVVLPWWFLLGEGNALTHIVCWIELNKRDMSGTIPSFSLLLPVTWVCWRGADDQRYQTPCEGLRTMFPSHILRPYFLGLDLWRRLRQWKLNALVGNQTVIVIIICFLPKRNLTEYVLISLWSCL